MKKVLLTTALIAALGTSASAQGIAPVSTAGETDVIVGTAGPALGLTPGLIAAGVAITIIGISVFSDTTDGTN